MNRAFVAAQDDCIPAQGDPIHIGAIFPEGGLLSVSVAEHFQGAKAMLDTINACGGVNGRPVEMITAPADNREQAAVSANRLISDGIPLIIGSGNLAVHERLIEIADQEHVVLWEVTESLDVNNDWVFSPRPSNYQLGVGAVNFIEGPLRDFLQRDDLRVALVYEDRPRGLEVTAGVLDSLNQPPLIQVGYSDALTGTGALATRIRDQRIDVVILVAFDRDADSLWYALRQADANIGAWAHVGSPAYRRDLCSRFGNNDGFISISPTGAVNLDYRHEATGDLYRRYRETYTRLFSESPTERADLSASGVYMLLTFVLPTITDGFDPQSVRNAIIETQVKQPAGLMGEGLAFAINDSHNQSPALVVQQRQEGAFCTAYPDSIATCGVPIVEFPTWRQRALQEETVGCTDPT
jgi:ABC-type branched-subunit amino acid transport system substrate-binding protein